MQNQTQAKKTKNKRALVYKPYLKGNVYDLPAMKRGLRLLAYFLMFAFLYLVVGSALQFDNRFFRVLMNILMVLICGAIVYMDGAKLGEAEVAFGEIAYTRQQTGKDIGGKDRERCYHPLKGVMIALWAAVPIIALTLPHALTAVKQVYSLQTLPKWVSGFSSQSQVTAPLQYYDRQISLTALDILRMLTRVLTFPFVNIASLENTDALLLVDRLSPLLACVPLIGFPLGYMSGPRSRAMVHGDISANKQRANRRRKKEIKARQARNAKKNELI